MAAVDWHQEPLSIQTETITCAHRLQWNKWCPDNQSGHNFMFHPLLPLSPASCCFPGRAGAVSVSAITNETIPLLLFFLLPSPTATLFTSLCRQPDAIWQNMLSAAPSCSPPLSLSWHRWQLNPTAACHAGAGRKWWCLCLEESGSYKTDSQAPVWMSMFRHRSCFPLWHRHLSGALEN